MERSDEKRREDALYDRLGSIERINTKQADKITELERIIATAKECVRITQEKFEALQINRDFIFKDIGRFRDALQRTQNRLDTTRAEYKRFREVMHQKVERWQEYGRNRDIQIKGYNGIIASLRKKIIEARRGAFGYMIKAEETLQQGMARNYQEFDDERRRLNKQIAILKEMIIQYQMAKLCWCDKCQEKRSMKEWRAKLEKKLNALVVVKEVQSAKKQTTQNEP